MRGGGALPWFTRAATRLCAAGRHTLGQIQPGRVALVVQHLFVPASGLRTPHVRGGTQRVERAVNKPWGL